MSSSSISQRFIPYHRSCADLNIEYLLPARSIDVVITSPPYNVGHGYEEYNDSLPTNVYLHLLNDLIKGVARVLKPDGLFIVDIAKTIKWHDGTPWPAVNTLSEMCKHYDFTCWRDYEYRAVISSDVSDPIRNHDDCQHILVFATTEPSSSMCPKTSPFQNEYVFGRGEDNDEAFWPPALVADFIRAFSLKDKTVLDPFMGRGLLGLMLTPLGGIFHGYEISKNLVDQAIDLRDSEFGAELIVCKDSFHELFADNSAFPDIQYVAMLVDDSNALHPSRPAERKYGSDSEKTDIQTLLNIFEMERAEKQLPYLGHVFLSTPPAGYDTAPSTFIYRTDHCIRVRFGDTDTLPDDYLRQTRLEDKEKDIFMVHCNLLSETKAGTFIGFLPLAYKSRIGFSSILYLIVVGRNYGPKIYTSVANSLLSAAQTAAYAILSRRVASLVNAVERHAERAATAAIMSRNMSHNLGSHALANSKFFGSVGLLDRGEHGNPCDELTVETREVKGARNRLQAFNQYCQGRLDFIARMLSEAGDRPEPMLLIGDVLMGFMGQYVLLDTLLDDNGFSTKNITFHITVNQDATGDLWEYFRDKPNGKGALRATDCCNEANKLIGLVGGITGAHALYALLENILRNAAKYSIKLQGDGMSLHLALFDYEALDTRTGKRTKCYMLRIWENQTDDIAGEAVNSVRKALSQEILDEETCRPVSKGHGVHEMRLCADYLAGGLRFPDEMGSPHEPGYPDQDGHEQDSEYVKYLKNENPISHLRNRALRAYRANSNGRQSLVYEMLLPMPVLLGLVCVKNGDYCRNCKSKHPNIRRFDDVATLAAADAHFGLILAHDTTSATLQFALGQVERVHTQLPYRLLVVTREDNKSYNDWCDEVTICKATPHRPVNPSPMEERPHKTALPIRRVHVIEHEGMFAGDRVCNIVASPNHDEDHTQLFCEIYEKWLRAWKGDPPGGRWKLCIGFSRDIPQVKQRWMEPLNDFCHTGKDLFDVFIGARVQQQDGSIQKWLARRVDGVFMETDEVIFPSLARNPCDGSDLALLPAATLVYDNHGEVFNAGIPENGSARFYHKFGLSQLSLYQTLETPPKEALPFAFFLFSLLEGSLMNILTLDERVADATIENGRFQSSSKSALVAMRRAGIHLLYTLRNKDLTLPDDPIFISPNVRVAMEAVAQRFTDFINITQQEGLHYQTDGAVTLSTMRLGDSPPPYTNWNNAPAGDMFPDAVVIHEGVTDTLARARLWQPRRDHAPLYQVVPAVVRTSGRGRQSRELGDWLPFIELSVLSDAAYGSLNKPKLARAILNSVGAFTEGQER